MVPSRSTVPPYSALPNVKPSGLVDAARGGGGWQQFLQRLIPGLAQSFQGLGQSSPQMPQPSPFDNLQMLDTSAPPIQMGGGNMAAIQQALQMLAQMMAARQAPPSDPTAGMYGGTGPGY